VTIQDLGSIGEFIAAIATVATLAYLAVQIRQNSSLLRRAGEDTAASVAGASIGLLAQSPENAAVIHRGFQNLESLSPEEQTHFYLLISSQFVGFNYSFVAHRDGAMSEELWEMQWQGVQLYLSLPGVRVWWTLVGSRNFPIGSGFRSLIEAELGEHQ
jgi:hypothetical protein